MATAREWLGMVAYIVVPVVGLAAWAAFTTWIADTTCPACPVEWRFLVFGVLTFVVLPIIGALAVLWFARKQWLARLRRGKLRRREFED